MGVSGTAVYAGYVLSPERNPKLIGQEKYRTFSDILANTSIVAAGMRYFLNIVAKPAWSCEPANDTAEAQKAAEFVEEALFEKLHTPWSRVVRRMGTYRFYGFAIEEWTAKRRDDGKIGLKDIEVRPQWTIWRWEVNERGYVTGVWQRDPLTGRELGLPRAKCIYLVDDTLTDNPEGLGLLRHVVEPVDRLREYQRQEGYGFLRDLRGVPVGRAPIDELQQLVSKGQLSKGDYQKALDDLLDFVRLERKGTDTAILLNSQPYVDRTDTGETMATQNKWGVELIQGAAPGLPDVGNAITRLNNEIARILGIEHLMLGATAAGSFALAKEKASNLYLLANSVLRDIRLQVQHDVLWPLWKLNGFDDELMPELKAEDVSPKDVVAISNVLRNMAVSGAPIMPDDEVQNSIRDLMGMPNIDLERHEDMSEQLTTPQPRPGEPGYTPASGIDPKDQLKMMQQDQKDQQQQEDEEVGKPNGKVAKSMTGWTGNGFADYNDFSVPIAKTEIVHINIDE
jgi:hypothetical protein